MAFRLIVATRVLATEGRGSLVGAWIHLDLNSHRLLFRQVGRSCHLLDELVLHRHPGEGVVILNLSPFVPPPLDFRLVEPHQLSVFHVFLHAPFGLPVEVELMPQFVPTNLSIRRGWDTLRVFGHAGGGERFFEVFTACRGLRPEVLALAAVGLAGEGVLVSDLPDVFDLVDQVFVDRVALLGVLLLALLVFGSRVRLVLLDEVLLDLDEVHLV
mmetsp:Transcript_2826/g.4408  ORF Transcript_2826/g.4408 Transcript_2826/m.4408 type:complete len:214 (-) Transcript_2826:49-690(-)